MYSLKKKRHKDTEKTDENITENYKILKRYFLKSVR